jgi:hypothetical protein
MSIIFSILEEHETVLIAVSGHVAREDVEQMRVRTLEIVEETKFAKFIMDISDLQSIDRGDGFAAFELGQKFRSTGFPLQAKTAVIMPSAPKARSQVEFLHTVEINRGRGELEYVDSVDAGLYWLRNLSA